MKALVIFLIAAASGEGTLKVSPAAMDLEACLRLKNDSTYVAQMGQIFRGRVRIHCEPMNQFEVQHLRKSLE
jgi:hypothetical protein